MHVLCSLHAWLCSRQTGREAEAAWCFAMHAPPPTYAPRRVPAATQAPPWGLSLRQGAPRTRADAHTSKLRMTLGPLCLAPMPPTAERSEHGPGLRYAPNPTSCRAAEGPAVPAQNRTWGRTTGRSTEWCNPSTTSTLLTRPTERWPSQPGKTQCSMQKACTETCCASCALPAQLSPPLCSPLNHLFAHV